jgi:hypothetical protein
MTMEERKDFARLAIYKYISAQWVAMITELGKATSVDTIDAVLKDEGL